MNGATQLRWTAAQARASMAAAPHTSLDRLLPVPGAVVVVAPHPDDESLGCGGLIALAAQAGRPVVIATLTDGAASHPNSRAWPAARLAALRGEEVLAAAAALAADRACIEAFGAPDGRLEAHEDAAAAWLAHRLANIPAAALFTTWRADPHPDHRAAFRIAERVASRRRAPLYAYPVWGLTLPDDAEAGPAGACFRLDVSTVLDRKRTAIAAHLSQTSALIDDDPTGFRLTSEDIARHLTAHEPFIRCAHAGVRDEREFIRDI